MIQSLDRGIQILLFLAEKSCAGITELAEALGVDKSTASRLVETLRARDMVRLDPETKKYRLGFRILHLGESLKDNLKRLSALRATVRANCNCTLPSAQLQFARTVARRAERRLWTLNRQDELPGEILRFMNRLSDLLFVMARYEMQQQNLPEERWQAFAYKRKSKT